MFTESRKAANKDNDTVDEPRPASSHKKETTEAATNPIAAIAPKPADAVAPPKAKAKAKNRTKAAVTTP
eukprot:6953659-Lingulodinium_polyedra.AAC.1